MVEPFSSPPLLNVLCVGLGTAAFFSPHIWLLRKIQAHDGYEDTLGMAVFKTTMAIFFMVALASLMYGALIGQGVLWPEVVVLGILMTGACIYQRLQNLSVLKSVFILVRFCCTTVFKIAAFMVLSFVVFKGLWSVFSFAQLNPLRDSTFIVGVLWIGVLYALHSTHCRGVQSEKGLQFHNVLWPLVVGLFILMIPILLQNLVNSEEFQESLHKSPPLHKV